MQRPFAVFRELARVLVTASALAGPIMSRAEAQTVLPNKVLLVHGLNGSGSDWAQMDALIQQQIPNVQTFRPTLNQSSGLDYEGQQLDALLGAGDTMGVAVAHSAGGVAARALDRYRSNLSHGKLRGIITVGSPLQGAGIAANLYPAIQYLGDVIWDIGLPLDVYVWDDPTGAITLGLVQRMLMGTVRGFVAGLPAQAVSELATGSSYMAGMNSAANLQREAASGLKRLAIVNESDPLYQLCRNVSETWHTICWTNQLALEMTYSFAATYYATLECAPDDEICLIQHDNWALWALGAGALWNADYNWCTLIDAEIAAGGCLADGFIPSRSQMWPDVTPAYYKLGGPRHSDEPKNDDIDNRIASLLLGNFDWPTPPPPPPPPISVQITGQTTIAPYQQCTWSAIPDHYEGTPNFAWTVNGVPVGDDSDQLTYGSPNPPFTIHVTVTADNGTASTSLYVALDANGWCQ